MTPVYTDELVKLICEDIAYNKGEVKLSYIWEIAAKFIEIKDENIKEYVFSCLKANMDIILYREGKVVQENFREVAAEEDNISVGISEDRLWIILTGYTKKESNLGGAAFELLLEIAKSRDKGINTKDLATATDQDPRSITGRVKKLESLICSVQMIYKGHVVKLLKLQKYAKTENIVKPYVNIRDYLPKIVDIVKNSKNGVRQIIDLKRELKLDVEKRLSKAFIAAINWLTEKGHLKKVLVVSPTNTAVKIRCVKYLRDYIVEEKISTDSEFQTDSEDEETIDYEKSANVDVDAYDGLDSFNATNLLQDENLILDEKNETERNKFLLNRFFPIQNQTYDFADASGLQGVSTMQVINKLTGGDYRRSFTKSTELYVKNVGKKRGAVHGYEIIRVYDFEGKKKFYRFFTGENFGKLTGDFQPSRDVFHPITAQNNNLDSLNRASFVPLSSTLRFIRREGQDLFFWNGELKVPPSINAQPLGRKRKHGEGFSGHVETTARKLPRATLTANSNEAVSSESSVNSENSEHIPPSKSEIINVGGFSANSLRSLWRQRAILEVVRRSGGITYLREQFFEDVSRYMGSSTMLDKKTVRGDVALMIKGNKLHDKTEPKTQRRIIFLADVDKSAVEDYVIKEKDNKKAHFKDVIHNTDIYFFDQTEKNKFHRGKRSAERVRQFQSRSKVNVGVSPDTPRFKRASTKAKSPRKPMNKRNDEGDKPASKEPESLQTPSQSSFHMGTKDGVKALVMAVVISKSIKNEIAWDQITKLFPNNSLENLKKQWTIRRIKMGHNGWKAHVDKWRKILVSAIKEERITLEEAERLDLSKLIGLWSVCEMTPNRGPVSLYRNYAENKRHYTFVRDYRHAAPKIGLAMSSMVQRETSLLKKVYVYDYSKVVSTHLDHEDEIRMVIRSLLFGKSAATKDDIQALKKIPRETLDKIVMEMAREKQVHLSGSKLEPTGLIQEVLESKGGYEAFEQSKSYRKKLEEMLLAKNGIIVSEEISDVASWTLIDLVASRKVCLDPLTAFTGNQPLSYTTRRFGVGALTPPLIVTALEQKLFTNLAKISIPIHEPNSRLWIDSSGSIRGIVWRNLVSLITREVLFNPGIEEITLLHNCGRIITMQELREICDWLLAKGLFSRTLLEGYCVTHYWYRLME